MGRTPRRLACLLAAPLLCPPDATLVQITFP
jgi:hypothetical protein